MVKAITKSPMVGNMLFKRLIVHWSKSYSEKTEFGAINKGLKIYIFENHFNSKCAYCSIHLASEKIHWDHAIPMNQTSFGLDVFGNIVPTHQECNTLKHDKNWDEFLMIHPNSEASKIIKKYIRHSKSKGIETVLPEKYRDDLIDICNVFSKKAAQQIVIWKKYGANHTT